MKKTYPLNRQIYLWKDKSICLGPSKTVEPRHYGAAAIHIGIYSPFEIIIGDKHSMVSQCAYVPVNTQHRLIMNGAVQGKFFIERDNPYYQLILDQLPIIPGKISCFHNKKLIEFTQWIYEENPSKKSIDEYMALLFNFPELSGSNIDGRIHKVIELTNSEAHRNLSQEYLANMLNISSSRFLHLFKENTDMTYRRYRIWRRIQKAMMIYYKTENLTKAALESGFTDVSHFSKAFKSTYGVNPALVFKKISTFELA